MVICHSHVSLPEGILRSRLTSKVLFWFLVLVKVDIEGGLNIHGRERPVKMAVSVQSKWLWASSQKQSICHLPYVFWFRGGIGFGGFRPTVSNSHGFSIWFQQLTAAHLGSSLLQKIWCSRSMGSRTDVQDRCPSLGKKTWFAVDSPFTIWLFNIAMENQKITMFSR